MAKTASYQGKVLMFQHRYHPHNLSLSSVSPAYMHKLTNYPPTMMVFHAAMWLKKEPLGQSDTMWAHTMLTEKQTISHKHYKTFMFLLLSADTFRDAQSAACPYCVMLSTLIYMHTHRHHDINLTKRAL